MSKAKRPTKKAKKTPAKSAKKAAKPSVGRKKPSKAAAGKKKAAKPAKKKPERAESSGPSGPVELGSVHVPSGELGIFDIGLVGYLPREALEPAIVKASVPADRALRVIGHPRFGERNSWDSVEIIIEEDGEVMASQKLGEVAIDLGRIACMDVAALDAWRHEEALDGRADVVFWGNDAQLAARILGAKRHADGYGWVDLPITKAETRYDDVGRKKSANKWQLTCELRPHSHHHQVLSAIAASPTRSTSLELAGGELAVIAIGGEGVHPVYRNLDAHDRLMAISIHLG